MNFNGYAGEVVDKPTYQLILNKLYKYGDILTPDPEFGDQVIVLDKPAPREVVEYPGNYSHTVKQVTNDPYRQLNLEEWSAETELTKISYAKQFGTHSNHVSISEGYADQYHDESQTFCKISANISIIK